MSDKLRWLQLVALLPLSVAAVPLLINQCSEIRVREALEKQAAEHAALGQQAEEAQDLALATQAYGDAVTADPDEPRFQKLLLDSYVKQIIADAGVINQNNALALHARIGKAITRTTDPSPELLMAFGRLLQFRGMVDQARARFKQAVDKAPKNPLAHLLLGDSLLKAGSLEAAAAELETSLEIEDSPLTQFALGQVRVKQERHEDALKHLEAAAEKLFNPNVFLALGQTYLQLKKIEQAETALTKALGLNPNMPGLQRSLAETYAQGNKIELAIVAYQKAFESNGDLENLRRVARIYRDTDQPDKAAEVFNRIRIVKPDDAEAHCNIGTYAEIQGDLMTAAAAYKQCIDHSLGKKDLQKLHEGAQKRLDVVNQAIAQVQAKQAAEQGKDKKPKK